MNNELQEYPTPKACAVAFGVSLLLVLIIGSVVQYLAVLPGLFVTEWVLILGPPLVLLWNKQMDFKKSLKLQQVTGTHILLGILGGIGIYFIMLGAFLVMESILGPYIGEEFLEKAFPTTWLGMIPWLLGIAVSAGICEEVLFRGFIQNGLHNYWGPLKAVVVTAILFGVFHVDPWGSPGAALFGLFAGYLFVRTGSLYTTIVLHMTANTVSQILEFTEMLPENTGQLLVSLVISLVLILIVITFLEKTKR